MQQDAVVKQGQEAVFPREELNFRVARARAALQAAGHDIMIVTGPENIFYLIGQQTPGYYTYQALLLPVDAEPVFIVRQLEMNNMIANSHVSDLEVYQDSADPVDVTVNLIKSRGWRNKRIAIDERGWFLPIAIYKALLENLGSLGNAAGVIESLRVIKSPLELEKLQQAASYVDAGMRAGLAAVKEGNSDNDFVAAMMGAAIAAGSEYVGMEPLASAGPRTGIPHGTWRRTTLRAGDPAFLEMAGCHDRYHAALMRSAWIGKPPAEALAMNNCCQEALQAALDAIKPGVTCEAVHNACQAIIDREGFTKNFKKRTGYSMGTSFAPDWGEGGILSFYTGVTRELEPGMVFHIPPALRRYGEFTVGVSETVVVTEDGCKQMGTIPRELTIVD
ncbi:MAG: Xaa-Pro peptidase family protein [Roseovarius sp.]|nr:Xaa-Pro peptidase family protein [Roseovarius sp.]MCY4207636.1 Xaa-Pro peptidase family protein [Roseovarius sp.]MCY4316976.1 Xaa-Pro peptidase family protein [Roseovarius sp.]